MKRIVVCCDGTWNTPDQSTKGEPSPTNITKIALQVAELDRLGREQPVYYDQGVGTGRLDHLTGGIFGLGLSTNVKDAYAYLVDTYDVGDAIYLFGFSRGAYTARSLAGLIRNCGLLCREFRHKIDDAYELYRDRSDTTHPNSVAAELFRRTWSREIDIHFIGVFETVGALGIPGIGLPFLTRRWQFHDTALSSRVHHAAHALALHERRGPFRPTLWTEVAGRKDPVRQVWFTGVHSDVGGGYRDPELAEIPLLWMVERAQAAGLVFRDGAFRQSLDGASSVMRSRGERTAPYTWGRRHNSFRFPYTLLAPYVRRFCPDVGGVQQEAGSAHERDEARLEEDRPATNPSFGEAEVWNVGPYPDPPGLRVDETMLATVRAAQRMEYTGIILERDGEYEITARGCWCDRTTVAGPAGYESYSRWLRWTEWCRRCAPRPWFELIGQVGGTCFPIGEAWRGAAPQDGELICWANDVDVAYGNNSGAVDVTVKRLR